MPRPENLPEIIETRAEEETCSQFVFGHNDYYLDEAMKRLEEEGEYRPIRGRDALTPIEGDIVFYGSPVGHISHVARVDSNGLLVSKFFGKPHVYRHELWGEPIPPFGVGYEVFYVIRPTSTNMSASSNL